MKWDIDLIKQKMTSIINLLKTTNDEKNKYYLIDNFIVLRNIINFYDKKESKSLDQLFFETVSSEEIKKSDRFFCDQFDDVKTHKKRNYKFS